MNRYEIIQLSNFFEWSFFHFQTFKKIYFQIFLKFPTFLL
jgi:hypothetical protein